MRPPSLVGANHQARIFRDYLEPERSSRDVLMIGSNQPREQLPEFDGHRVTQIDLNPYPYVDVVADAERLTESFRKDSFDYVVCTSMLEHTPHPERVLAEVFAVLRPGGVLYPSVPWMFPLHGEPNDFWRFSMPCLERLLREHGFVEREADSEYSPHGAIHVLLKTYLCEALSFDRSALFYALEYLFSWLLAPLQLLEYFFRLGRRRNYYTDSLLYVVGQKPGANSTDPNAQIAELPSGSAAGPG